MNSTLEWVILITSNYQGMKNFYKTTLDFPVAHDVPEEEFTQFQMKNCYLAVYGKSFVAKLVEEKYLGKSGGAIYSFGESEDVDRDYQQLLAKGVQFTSPPQTRPWGQRTAYFTDPDGNIWEIQQWVNKRA